MRITAPKPAILERLGPSHGVIEASAGTGKTYTLEHLVVDLLLGGIALEQILVVTFTKKATLELKARVRAKLEALVGLATDQARPGEPAWTLDPPERDLLRTALLGFDRATIATIHGFCQQVVQDAAFEGGRLFKQELVSTDEAFDRAFKTLLRTRFAHDGGERALFERALTRQSLDALKRSLQQAKREWPALVLPDPERVRGPVIAFPAALGRRFLDEFAGYQALTGRKVPPPLLAAFSDAGVAKASFKAMAERIRRLLAAVGEAERSGCPGLFWSAVELKHLQDQEKNFIPPGLDGDALRLGQAYQAICAHWVEFDAVVVGALLPPVVAELQRFKAEEGLFDFDDMIGLVHETVTSVRGEPLVERLRQRYQVALIDEFQDTDHQQWEIFQRLFLASKDPRHRLILVGDPKQAIYGFRSGDLPTYLEAVATVKGLTGREPQALDTNFRSTPAVIEAYGEIFAGSPEAPFFTGRNRDQYVRGVLCGKPELRLLDADGAELAAIRSVDVEAGKTGRTLRKAALRLAETLKEILTVERPRFPRAGTLKVLGPEDVFVLTRSAAEGKVMAAALKGEAIPHAFFKQDGLFSTPEAAAVRDLLRAIDAPLHPGRRAKALLGPFFGLTFQEAETCRDLPETHPILKRLFAWRELARTGRTGEFFARLISESGVTQRLLFLEDGERALTNFHHLLELVQAEALGRHGTLLDLALLVQRWIDGLDRPTGEEADTQRLERETGAVQILTMHKSKGLEAPVVMVLGGFSRGDAKAKLFRYHDAHGRRRAWIGGLGQAGPEIQAAVAAEEQEEGERLMYVALTRAKALLILPRIVLGSKPPHALSPFDAAGHPKGCYGAVNRRLLALLGPPGAATPRPRFRPEPAREPRTPKLTDPAGRLAQWTPRAPAPLQLPDFAALARAGRPTWKFSYTSLQKGLVELRRDPEAWEEHRDPEGEDAGGEGPRGGAKLGTLVHDLLQAAKLSSFAGRTLEAWLEAPETLALFQDVALTGPDRRTVGEWIYRGLGCPLPLPGGGAATLCEAPRLLRELDFLTPYPGRRDLLNGSVDVLFQWAGKAYVLDWKTNRLPSYGPDRLEAAVREEYLLQVKAYAVAACRFLGLASREAFDAGFGGILYVFLRGLPADAGVWLCRPTWLELRAWERDLEALPVERLIPVHAGGEPHV